MQRTFVLRGLDTQYVYTFTSIKKSLENEKILALIVSFFYHSRRYMFLRNKKIIVGRIYSRFVEQGLDQTNV